MTTTSDNNSKVLAIIPARGGSKGLSNKNIYPLIGKPLIGWIIEEAVKCESISELVVSTDSQEIADIANGYGAKTPFLRPDWLSKDSTPGIEPIIHAIEYYQENHFRPDITVCLQCTAPLTKQHHIDEAIQKFKQSNFETMVSVCSAQENPYWMVSINPEEKIEYLLEQKDEFYQRQNLPKAYSFNGAIYIAWTDALLKEKKWVTNNTGAYVMDHRSSFDVDTIEDIKALEQYHTKHYKPI